MKPSEFMMFNNLVEYKEIFKLKKKLEKANIPFVWIEHDIPSKKGYQICYPDNGIDRVCSVIEHSFSYGNEQDKLEIMGLLTPKEEESDSVVGWLSAKNVFKRIEKHYKGVNYV